MAAVPGYAGSGSKPSARGLYSGGGGGHGSGRQHRPSSFQSSVFSIEEILAATNNFSPALKIGQGGFGAVYKGVLPDGTVVAVKRAKLVSRSRSTLPDALFSSQSPAQIFWMNENNKSKSREGMNE